MYKLFIPLLFFAMPSFGQTILTYGIFGELKIAFNQNTNKVNVFYEDKTGYDEPTGNSKFSCIFYIEGKLVNNKAFIWTYFPSDRDNITGTLTIENKVITVHLQTEHGGCQNVQHFSDKEPASFTIDEEKPWIQIQYAIKEKVYFYSDLLESSKRNAYILKGNIVYIEKIVGDWVYCSFFGKKTTKGWIQETDLNTLKINTPNNKYYLYKKGEQLTGREILHGK